MESPVTQPDLDVLQKQLGRVPRGVVAIVKDFVKSQVK